MKPDPLDLIRYRIVRRCEAAVVTFAAIAFVLVILGL